MKYEVVSELGKKRFRKIKSLRDWLLPFHPRWLHKLTIYRITKNNLEKGRFVNNKKLVIFNS